MFCVKMAVPMRSFRLARFVFRFMCCVSSALCSVSWHLFGLTSLAPFEVGSSRCVRFVLRFVRI